MEEVIQIHGIDTYYVVRTLNDFDPIYGTDDQSSYTQALDCEMYVDSVRGFSGQRDFMSAFGAQIRDEVVLSVSKTAFEKNCTTVNSTLNRPREGDLIYVPLNQKCFNIKFVESREMFYPLGALYTYQLTCEVFEYSGEKFDTGIEEIDAISGTSTNVLDWTILSESGDFLVTEHWDYLVLEAFDTGPTGAVSDNIELTTDFENIADFTDENPWGLNFSNAAGAILS